MAPPQPRKGPVRVPQNPLMGGVQNATVQPNQMIPRVAPFPAGGLAAAIMGGAGFAGSALREQAVGNGLPQVPRASFGAMPNGQMIPREPMSPVQQADWARAREEASQRSSGGVPPSPLGIPSGDAFAYGMSSSPSRGALLSRQPPASPLSAGAQSQMEFNQRQEQARFLNTYGGMFQPQRLNPLNPNELATGFEPTAGQVYSNGLSLRPDDIRSRLASREAAMQPGGVQMQRRFAPASPLGQQAAEYQRGQTGVDRGEGVFIQEGGYGSDQKYLQFNNTPEGAAAVAAEKARSRREDRTAPGFRSEETRAAQLQKGLDRRKAAIEAGLPKQRAEARNQKLQDRTLQRAVTRGLNPLSPQAQALYPEAAGRLRALRAGGQGAPANPLNQNEPFRTGPGGTTTAQDRMNSEVAGVGLVHGIPGPPDKDGNPTPGPQGNPFLQQMGAAPDKTLDTDVNNLHSGMLANLESANPVTPSPADLRAVWTYLKAVQGKNGDTAGQPSNSLFIGARMHSAQADAWKDLSKMPANATDEQLVSWYDQWKRSATPGKQSFSDRANYVPPSNPLTQKSSFSDRMNYLPN